MRKSLSAILMLMLLMVFHTKAQQFSIRTSTGSGMDAMTWTDQPNTNHGTGSLQAACANWSTPGGRARIFLKFDMSSLPSGYSVRSAKLSMYGIPGGAGHYGNNASIISRVVQPWQENIITWNNAPVITTVDSVHVPALTSFQNYSQVDITEMIRTMYADADSNMGLMIRLQQEIPYTMLAFASKDWTDSTLHPYLEIELDTIAPPPPPPPITLSFGLRTSTGSGMDAMTWTNQPNTNHGTGSLQVASSSWSGVFGTTHTYLKFDMSSLPSGYSVRSAKLSMYGIPGGVGHYGNNASVISRVVQPWQENIITWNNAPVITTVDSVHVPALTSFQNYSQVDITEMIRTMYADADSNMGLMIRLQQEIPYTMLAFASKDWTDSTLHPYLEIELDTIAPPPPPPPITLSFGLRTSTGSGMDAMTWTNQPNTNHGTGSLQVASSSWSGVFGTTHTYLKFDMSSLPSGYSVRSAKLSMYGIPGGVGHYGNNASVISRVVQPWQENIITWNNAPVITTVDSVHVPALTSFQNYSQVDITEMIRTMYADADSNMGLMIRLQQEIPYTMLAFASKDWTDSTLHPYLEIELDTIAPPPPPPPITLSFGLRTSTGSGMDAMTWTNQPNTNHGTGSLQVASSSWSGVFGTTHTYLKFDMSSLPSGYSVRSAKLSMYGIPGGVGHYGNNASVISRVVQPWQENIITWNNAPVITTVDSVHVPALTSFQNYSQVDITEMIRTMYADADSNMGLMIRLQQEIPYTMLAFASKDWTDSTLHPYLEIELDTIVRPITLSSTKEPAIVSAKVYPNPASNQFYFFITEDIDLNRMVIIDQQGRRIQATFQLESPSVASINSGQLQDGFYILQYVMANGGVLSKKVIIRH